MFKLYKYYHNIIESIEYPSWFIPFFFFTLGWILAALTIGIITQQLWFNIDTVNAHQTHIDTSILNVTSVVTPTPAHFNLLLATPRPSGSMQVLDVTTPTVTPTRIILEGSFWIKVLRENDNQMLCDLNNGEYLCTCERR